MTTLTLKLMILEAVPAVAHYGVFEERTHLQLLWLVSVELGPECKHLRRTVAPDVVHAFAAAAAVDVALIGASSPYLKMNLNGGFPGLMAHSSHQQEMISD